MGFLLRKNLFVILCTIGVAINALGLFTGVMLGDGVLYAVIAKNMVVNQEYVFLTVNGMDWLDKPHFPFWCAALSYQVFGVCDFAYKLPAFLFWLVGAVYTYFFSKQIYNKGVAQLATLIYLSTLHLLISNVDVRAEPYLTGMIVAAMYHFYQVYKGKALKHLLFASLWAAMAVMTKGIFVLIVIGSGFVVLWMVKREWAQFVNYRWYIAILLVLIFIFPELYSLYEQFDARPETVVFGETGVSGIRFFFWDSQFGRFVNSGPIKGAGDPFFYLHTILWAFLPWSLLLPFLVYFSITGKRTEAAHPLLWGTVVITFLMFSVSRFQLPHYLNIIFPILSICLGHFLYHIRPPLLKYIHKVQWYVGALLICLICVLIYLFHGDYWYVMGMAILVMGILSLIYGYRTEIKHTVVMSFMVGLTIGVFYAVYLYPNLLNYQSGDAMAHYINEVHPGVDRVNILKGEINNLALNFQSDVQLHIVSADNGFEGLDIDDPVVLHSSRWHELETDYEIVPITSFPDYHVSKIKPRFFYYVTREETLGRLYLVRLKRKFF